MEYYPLLGPKLRDTIFTPPSLDADTHQGLKGQGGYQHLGKGV